MSQELRRLPLLGRRYIRLGSGNVLNGLDVNHITGLIERASDFYVLPFADSDEGDRGSGLMVISIPGSM